ncbi:MAG: hypothetical protein LBD23_14820, partial [Oscillospiraceae bacterium]|nr:hypothetical protein [Oscillospiraceae bacterium]
LYRKVKCRQSLRLIRKWLRAPIQLDGKLIKRRKGAPQGSLCDMSHNEPYGKCIVMGSVLFNYLNIKYKS